MGVNCSTGRKTAVIHDIRDGLNYKILLLGDSGVGKTSVFRRFVENTFDPVHRPTTRPLVKNVFQKVNVPADYVVSITLWDVPIKEDIDMRESYYRNVDAVIVVADMTDSTSIKLVGTWKQDFVNNATKTFTVTEVLPNGQQTTTVRKTIFNPYEVPFLLLGNKFDQVEDQIKEKILEKMIENPVLDNLDTLPEASGSYPVLPDSVKDDGSAKAKITKKYYNDESKSITENNKPECVSLLEEIETKYNFIGSMLVSAKLSDGSVDLAFQLLLRHLLSKNISEKKKGQEQKQNMHQSTKKMKKQEREKYLMYCGIEQIDELFEKCYIPVKRADHLDTYYNLIITRFQQTCLNNGFTETLRATMEDCITGINEALYQSCNVKLKVEEDGEFIKLVWTGEPKLDIPESVELTVNIFNNEYAAVCKTIIKECPRISDILFKLTVLLEKLAEELTRRYDIQANKYVNICHQNEARVAFAKKQALKCLRETGSIKEKVDAALVWK